MKIQNRMKTNNFLKKTAAITAMITLGFAFSCQENETPYGTEASYVAEESVTDVYFEDADDMAGVAVASESSTGGKVSSPSGIVTVDDDRFCANLTLVLDPTSTLEIPVGTITIDFGDGCEDPRGNVRKGKIIISFHGRRFLPESTVTLTFEGYSINGIALEGIRTLTNISGSTEVSPKFRVSLDNGKATWPDGTVATREHCFEREWVRALNPIADQLLVSQCADVEFAATGTNRRGVEYRMIIVEELVYKRGCPIAVSGVKTFVEVSTGKEITIDYGDGTCDSVITITVEGSSRSVNVRRRG